MAYDERIIDLFFLRSEQAIRELDMKYGKACHALSYNIVNDKQDAEECVNDAYLGAWNTIPPTKPNSLQAYISKIVRNISLKLYYRKGAAKRDSTYEVAMQELEPYLSAPSTVEAEIETRELARIIESFLNTLSEENCVIVGEVFIVCVMDHEPDTNSKIYSSTEEVTLLLLEESRGIFIRTEDCYVSVFIDTAEPTAVLDALRNIV